MQKPEEEEKPVSLPPPGISFEEFQRRLRLLDLQAKAERYLRYHFGVVPPDHWSWRMNYTWDPKGEVPFGPRFKTDPEKAAEDPYDLG
jgi:hypothetical protein